MINPFDLFVTSLLLMVLLYVYFSTKSLNREIYRFRLRKIRDDLFDFMYQNNLSYDDENYKSAREYLNMMIKTSNTISVFHIVSMYRSWKKLRVLNGDEALSVKYGDNPLLASKLKDVNDAEAKELSKFIFLTGITGVFLKTLYYCCILVLFVKSQFNSKKKFLLKQCESASSMYARKFRLGSLNTPIFWSGIR